MASQTTQSILANLGAAFKKAHEKNKDNAPVASNFGDLPAGITGIAQLNSFKLGIYQTGENKGKPFWMAMGTVLEPKVHNNIPIEGLFTKMGPNPLCDTPKGQKYKTLADHIGRLYNTLGLLGVDVSELDYTDIGAAIDMLVEEAPCFRFSTWKGQKQKTGPYKDQEPQVKHQWGAKVDFEVPDDDGAVEDDSSSHTEEDVDQTAGKEEDEPEETPTPVKKAKTPAPAPKASAKPSVNGNGKASTPAKAGKAKPFDEYGDLDSLLEKANDEDEEAQEELRQMVLKSGTPQKILDKAKTWEDVVALLQGKAAKINLKPEDEEEETQVDEEEEEGGSEEEDEETEEDDEEEGGDLEVGGVAYYTPPGTRKAVECVITKVNPDNKTVNLKSLVDNKTVYKGVKGTDLKPGK